jgi:hypothetical protein
LGGLGQFFALKNPIFFSPILGAFNYMECSLFSIGIKFSILEKPSILSIPRTWETWGALE